MTCECLSMWEQLMLAGIIVVGTTTLVSLGFWLYSRWLYKMFGPMP